MLPLGLSVQALDRLLASGVIEFLDLGCGSGGSYGFIRRYTDMKVGVSLDLSQDKITQCREVNDLSFAFDVSNLPNAADSVASAFCMHFLEHVDDAATVFRIIERALIASRDFLIVRQPYFDHDGDLAAVGCKTYWSDWHGHKTKLTREMVEALSVRLGARKILRGVSIRGMSRITNTSDDSVLPLDAAPDQHRYNADEHGPKPLLAIDFDCFREIFIVFERNTISDTGRQRLDQIVANIDSRATMLHQVGSGTLNVVAA